MRVQTIRWYSILSANAKMYEYEYPSILKFLNVAFSSLKQNTEIIYLHSNRFLFPSNIDVHFKSLYI